MERAVSGLGGRLMKIKERNSIENSLAYLKMILKRLSSSFEEQYAEIEDFAKYNLINDILSDWDDYEQVVKCLLEAKLIDREIEMKFTQLVSDFDRNNQKAVWSLDGLKNHPFWELQRQRAKQLLNELDKIKL